MEIYALYAQRFAANGEYGTDVVSVPDFHSEKVSIRRGFTPRYSASEDAAFVRRGEMNYLVKIVADMYDYIQHGGLLTFEEEVARYIGGYPKGAILNYYKLSGTADDSAEFIRVMSLKDNNTDNFVKNPGFIDGVSWTGITTKIFPYWEKMDSASLGDDAAWTAPFDCWLFINGTAFQSVVVFLTHAEGAELPKKVKIAETTYLNVLRHGTTTFASQFLCSKGDRFQFEILPNANKTGSKDYHSWIVNYSQKASVRESSATVPKLDLSYCPVRV